jgi:DNA-binding transcriptional ArsR family regulator
MNFYGDLTDPDVESDLLVETTRHIPMSVRATFDMSLPAVSKHLKVLEHAGLITRGREAQWRPCRIEPKALMGIDEWLERYRKLWNERFDRLENYLNCCG